MFELASEDPVELSGEDPVEPSCEDPGEPDQETSPAAVLTSRARYPTRRKEKRSATRRTRRAGKTTVHVTMQNPASPNPASPNPASQVVLYVLLGLALMGYILPHASADLVPPTPAAAGGTYTGLPPPAETEHCAQSIGSALSWLLILPVAWLVYKLKQSDAGRCRSTCCQRGHQGRGTCRPHRVRVPPGVTRALE